MLTRRQTEILEMLAHGASDAEISRTLGIAERTLRWHLANVHERLGTHSRVQMMAVAMHHRLLPDLCPCSGDCPLCAGRVD